MARRLAIAAVVIAVCASIGAEITRACGDKFLIVGGGPSVPRLYASIHPSTILVVRRGAGFAIDSPVLVSSLKRAGHLVKVADSQRAVAQVLAGTKVDVILADLTDAKVIAGQVQGTTGHPAVVPVLSDPTAAQVSAASQEFACLLKAPDRAVNFLKVLDDLLAERNAANRAPRKN